MKKEFFKIMTDGITSYLLNNNPQKKQLSLSVEDVLSEKNNYEGSVLYSVGKKLEKGIFNNNTKLTAFPCLANNYFSLYFEDSYLGVMQIMDVNSRFTKAAIVDNLLDIQKQASVMEKNIDVFEHIRFIYMEDEISNTLHLPLIEQCKKFLNSPMLSLLYNAKSA